MDVIEKVQKIRRINNEKELHMADRKTTAKKHQEMLSNYFIKHKLAYMDERPLVYTEE